mgnify:CR=1 FL=1
MFRATRDAFPLQTFEKSASPVDHLVSGFPPTSSAQGVLDVLIEQFEVEHGRKIDIDAELMQHVYKQVRQRIVAFAIKHQVLAVVKTTARKYQRQVGITLPKL